MSPPRSLVISGLFCLVALGCASPWKKEIVHAESGAFIYVEHEERDGAIQPQGFDHPVEMTVQQVAGLFLRLFHESRSYFWDPPEVAPVFRPQEIQALAKPIAEQLARLGPDERLRFLVTRNSPGGLQAKYDAVYGVSGVMFRTKDGHLQLAFSAIDDPVDEGDEGRPDEMRFRDPLADPPDLGLIAVEGAVHHRDPASDELYRRWIEIDLPELLATPPRTLADLAPGKSQDGPPAAPGDSRTETSQPVGAAATPGNEGTQSPATEAEEARYQEIKTKAEILKRLKEEGTISEEDYRRELDELMKDL